jgi:uncharacterized membrane protein YphA (DoxX/SURF4 family)
MAVNSTALGLTALRTLLGVFFLLQGLSKVGWFTDPSILAGQLAGFLQDANAWNRPYLELVCIPGAPIFARLVPIGEMATGLAFLFGAYTRPAALAALAMVLNFHFASGIIFTLGYLTNGYGPPVLGGLTALALGGGNLPLSLKRS